jgi:competence protein ComEC
MRRTFEVGLALAVSAACFAGHVKEEAATVTRGSARPPSSSAAPSEVKHKEKALTQTLPAELIVRILNVGQGDAAYIENGASRVIIDGGPDPKQFGRFLDSLNLNNTTIDAVVLSHPHSDHYNGLRALFDSRRKIKIRYFFENKDLSPAGTLARLRDSINARRARDSLVYRDTDDPCADGRSICTISLRGGAKLHILRPVSKSDDANNRSTPVKLIGPDSTSFTMWFAGDAERQAIDWFLRSYSRSPGMDVAVLKANHHGSCDGVSLEYLNTLTPDWAIVSLASDNDYGHMHTQAKVLYRARKTSWYRTDQNGTITIKSSGTSGGGYSVSVERGEKNMDGPSDRRSTQGVCGRIQRR